MVEKGSEDGTVRGEGDGGGGYVAYGGGWRKYIEGGICAVGGMADADADCGVDVVVASD